MEVQGRITKVRGNRSRYLLKCASCETQFSVGYKTVVFQTNVCCPSCDAIFIGRVFGKLTVIGPKESHKWCCRCSCENHSVVYVSASNLRAGVVKSCGCLKAEVLHQKIKEDLLGMTFGRLRVLEFKGSRELQSLWLCYCDPKLGGCGTYLEVKRNTLVNGHTHSCGCLFVETHSGQGHSAYKGVKTEEYMLNAVFECVRIVGKVGDDTWEGFCDPELGGCGERCVRRGDTFRSRRFAGHCGCKYRESQRGKGNPAWAGGYKSLHAQIRSLSEYDTWRLGVFKRDNFTCQMCFKRSEGDIESHHRISLKSLVTQYNIDSQDDAINCSALWEVENGITLCKKCHKKVHQQ